MSDKTPNEATTNIRPDAERTVVRTAATEEATRVKPRSTAAASSSVSKQPAFVNVGDKLKQRFHIVELIGRGGMSEVYRAVDQRKLEAQDKNPHVAVKVLGAAFADHPKGFVALQREARKSQTLAHPNIITVYDFDRDGDIVFMTMEELKGTPLDTLIRNNPAGLDQQDAVRIIGEVAKGLAHAHSKGIVHADLKPGNIFLCEDNSVKILDFGIARAASVMEDFQASEQTVFDAGELGGLTPSYASYEMFQHREPHPSDDIYALGLISYELLTGKHPYAKNTALEVEQRSLVPPTVKNLNRRQASVLKASILLHRQDRIQNAIEFSKQFEQSSTLKMVVAALVLVVFILTGAVIIQSNDNEGPAVPFDSLAPELQAKFNDAIALGDEALQFGDINGAVFHFNAAYALHPRNEQAEERLDAVVDKVLAAAKKAPQISPEEKLQQINILLEYESLAANEDLLSYRDKLLAK